MIDVLAPGTRLGPYEIIQLVGAGGMGQVYRARDPRLERDVAIKTLAGPAKRDADLIRRFEIEAKAVGALDHPNLLVVYDVGLEGDVSYIVSELLDGETLSARLQNGALSMREVTDYTTQIARGLSAAHARGIIHRDLKPENLFVTRDGRVKILDFGVAKLTRAAEVDASTAAVGLATGAGVAVGTASYMAPEQVRAERDIDHRVDIFALGLVMYEMASGIRPFRRDTIPETLTAILKDDAPELPASVNPAVARIIGRCLEKRPEHRFHSAHDLSLAIELLSASTGSSTVPAAAAIEQPAPAISRRRAITFGAASLGLVAAGVGVGSWLRGPRAAAVPPSLRRLTFRRGVIRSARAAPDGQTYLVGAAWDGGACRVYAGRLDSPESNPLDPPDSNVLAISRSGEVALALGVRNTAVFAYGTLAKVSITGGAPRQMLEHVKFADWSPDGRELAIIRLVDGHDELEYPIGRVLVRAEPDEGTGLGFVRLSADGERLAFVRYRSPDSLAGRVVVADLKGTVMRRSDEYLNIHGLAWQGDEVWYTAADDGPLFRTLRALTAEGTVRTLMRVPTNLTLWDTLPGGRCMFAQTDDHGVMIARGRETGNERTLSWHDLSSPTDMGRDGQTLLFNEIGQSVGTGRFVAYLRRLDGTPPVRLGNGYAFALSPDGRRVLWHPLAASDPHLEVIPTGAGAPERLPGGGLRYTWAKWLPDGRRVVASASEPGRLPKLILVEPGTTQPKTISPEGIGKWVVSPDGSAIAARSPSGAIRIYPIDGSAPRDVAGMTGAETPIGWIADGLLVVGSGEVQGDIHKVDVRTGRREHWTNILPEDPAGILLLQNVVVSPDGRSLAYTWARALSNLYMAEGLA